MRRLGIGDPDERVKWDDLAELRLITDLPSFLSRPTNSISTSTSSRGVHIGAKRKEAVASFLTVDHMGIEEAILCSPFSTPKF